MGINLTRPRGYANIAFIIVVDIMWFVFRLCLTVSIHTIFISSPMTMNGSSAITITKLSSHSFFFLHLSTRINFWPGRNNWNSVSDRNKLRYDESYSNNNKTTNKRTLAIKSLQIFYANQKLFFIKFDCQNLCISSHLANTLC